MKAIKGTYEENGVKIRVTEAIETNPLIVHFDGFIELSYVDPFISDEEFDSMESRVKNELSTKFGIDENNIWID